MRNNIGSKSTKKFKSVITICILMLLPMLISIEVYAQGITTQASVSSAGVPGNDLSVTPSISSDGRFVTFQSYANNLVVGDTNGDVERSAGVDIFVHDRLTGETTRVSISSVGLQANNFSGSPSISSDGRFVTFQSYANNLVAGDTNGDVDPNAGSDIFVHDRLTGQTTRVSLSIAGMQANDRSDSPSISSDGRFVAFRSNADNLVAGDTNGAVNPDAGSDIFVHDRLTGQTTRVSLSSVGVQANNFSGSPSISSDGRFVAFRSDANNLVAGDTNGDVDPNEGSDIFVHDRLTGQTTRVSVSSAGMQANNRSDSPSISSDGRFVAFSSNADNLVAGDTNNNRDIFLHDRQTDQTTRVSESSANVQGNGASQKPSTSDNGRFVAFESRADNLVDGDTNNTLDILFHDCQTGQTIRVNVSSSGAQGNGDSYNSSISDDGRFVAFHSWASNLVDGDTNNNFDVFVYELLAVPTGQTLPFLPLLLIGD